jgi:hypothetical protein
MNAPFALPPPIRSAARTPLACPGGRLSLEGMAPPRRAPRTPGAALPTPAPALPRRLQLQPAAS